MTLAGDERQRDFARTRADWSWSADDGFRITHLCSRFAVATGRAASQHLGRNLDSLGTLAPALVRAFEARRAFDGQRLTIADAAERRAFSLTGTPRFSDDGRFEGYDGTAVRAAGTAEPDANDRFLSEVGHAFRTPLSAIIGFADVMNGETFGPVSERYAGYARDIAQAGRHLLSLIEGVLGDVADTTFAPALLAPVDVDAAIDRAMRLTAVAAAARDITVVHLESPRGLAATGDAQRLAQIMVNFVTNAIKASPDGGTIGITARETAGRVEIEVSDEGPGIAPEDQARIFDRFERVVPTKADGAGLGLAIARGLAESMAGDIRVASAPGEGARFTLSLPRG